MRWNLVKIPSSDRELRNCALIKLSQSKMEVIVDRRVEIGGNAPRGVEEMNETSIPPPKTLCLKVFFYISRLSLLHYCSVLLLGFSRLKEETPCRQYK
jgi:hypothetical protein